MEDREISLIDYWNIIWKRRKFIITTVVIVTVIAVIISLILPKWYKATVVIMPPETEEMGVPGMSATLGAFGLGDLFGGGASQMRLLSILKSRSLLEAMNDRYDFQTRYKQDSKEKTLEKLKDNISITVGDEEQIIVSFWDKDQDMVADMANYLVHCLDSLNIALSTGKARTSREFIENRLELVQDSLVAVENRLTDFMKQHGLISINDQMRVAVEQAASIKAEIMAKEVEIEVKKRLLTPEAPEIRHLEQELYALQNKFSEFYSPSGADKLFPAFDALPEIEKEFLQLQREVKYYTELLQFLGPQYEQAKIEEARDIPTVQVLDEAARPEKRDSPKRKLIVILAFLISLLISIFIAFLIEKLYQVRHS